MCHQGFPCDAEHPQVMNPVHSPVIPTMPFIKYYSIHQYISRYLLVSFPKQGANFFISLEQEGCGFFGEKLRCFAITPFWKQLHPLKADAWLWWLSYYSVEPPNVLWLDLVSIAIMLGLPHFPPMTILLLLHTLSVLKIPKFTQVQQHGRSLKVKNRFYGTRHTTKEILTQDWLLLMSCHAFSLSFSCSDAY